MLGHVTNGRMSSHIQQIRIMQIKDADLCTFTHFSTSMQLRNGEKNVEGFDEEMGSRFQIGSHKNVCNYVIWHGLQLIHAQIMYIMYMCILYN